MEANKRVGAVCSMDKEVITLFGYGVYEGDFIPDTDDITMMGLPLRKMGLANPRIRLDNGDVVWGCECWWGAEEIVKTYEENRKVKIITIAQYRWENEVEG